MKEVKRTCNKSCANFLTLHLIQMTNVDTIFSKQATTTCSAINFSFSLSLAPSLPQQVKTQDKTSILKSTKPWSSSVRLTIIIMNGDGSVLIYCNQQLYSNRCRRRRGGDLSFFFDSNWLVKTEKERGRNNIWVDLCDLR